MINTLIISNFEACGSTLPTQTEVLFAKFYYSSKHKKPKVYTIQMTHGNYDWDAFYNVGSLQQSRNREDQERLNGLLYAFGSENGWKVCASFLLRDNSFNEIYQHTNDLNLKDFFCFRGIEEYIKSWYSNTNIENVNQIHLFILKMMEYYVSNKFDKKDNFLRNKCIHIATKIAIIDYPNRWPSFFKDFVYIIHRSNEGLFEKENDRKNITYSGSLAFELFFKFLISWDNEVGSREMQTNQFIERNTAIKDWMRDNDIVDIVSIVVFVITFVGSSNPILLKKALKVISLYISWIDIRLVVTDEILDGIMKPLLPNLKNDDNLKSASLDCLLGIVNKGMSASHKVQLIMFLQQKLVNNGVWQWIEIAKDIPDDMGQEFGCDEDDNDNCFFVTIGSLINACGLNLIDSYKTLKEMKNESSIECMRLICNNMKLALAIAKSTNNFIAESPLPFIQNFVTVLKSNYRGDSKKARRTSYSKLSVNMSDEEIDLIRNCLTLLTTKLQYPKWYNFNKEDEPEGKFQTFRRSLLNILTNIIQLNEQIPMKFLLDITKNTVTHGDALPYEDVEMVLTMIYHVGEAVKSVKGDYFCNECEISKFLKEIMQILCSSEIGHHKNPEVRLVFFEMIFRYEKFFNHNPEFLMGIIFLFLSEHGLKSSELRVVTRCVYILSRLIKSHKAKFVNTSLSVLQEITSILQSSFLNNAILTCENPSTISAYCYLYETAVLLLVSINITERQQIFHNLIQPILIHVPQLCSEWASAAAVAIPSNDPILHSQNINNIKANRLALSIHSAATYINYTCRAFSGAYSMSGLNCLEVFMNALDVFIGNLQLAFNRSNHPLAVGREKINSGLRSLIHILCKSAQSDSIAINMILQRLPMAIELFLSHLSLNIHGLLPLCTELEEIIPLFMQIINGFKTQSIDFLKTSLWTLLNICDNVINASTKIEFNGTIDLTEQEINDKVRQLRRLYLQLITSDVQLVFTVLSNDETIKMLSSCIPMIHNIEHLDPISIKLCVQLFHKIVNIFPTLNSLDQHSKEVVLYQLNYKQLLPLLIYLPSCEKFNLSDAQFHLALMEMANYQRSLFLNGGSQFLQYLQNHCLRELNFNSDLIQQYCQALNHNEKDYQAFIKDFYLHAKSK